MKSFKDIDVSTRTIIALSNLTLDIGKLFTELKLTKYTVIPKKRGRKKIPVEIPPENKDVKQGSIITLKYFENLRGVDLKNKPPSKKYFRNALTIVMYVDEKFINFKVAEKGKFQMTGCKTVDQAEKAIRLFLEKINPTQYVIRTDNSISVIFNISMTNKDFKVNYCINREKLDSFINNNTEYTSLFEPTFGYSGVNIKIPMRESIDTNLRKITYDFDTKNWNTENVEYSEYLKRLSDKERIKHSKKERYNTFLVFHSGKVIHSGMCEKYMEDSYNYFVKNIITDNRDNIEEYLD